MLVKDVEMLVDDGEMHVNNDEMNIWSYTHLPSLTRILVAFAWSIPSFAHLTIIEKLHQL